jgi:hypothetical protein
MNGRGIKVRFRADARDIFFSPQSPGQALWTTQLLIQLEKWDASIGLKRPKLEADQ